jgi:hypothetical protein
MAINYSPLQGEVPQSGAARGMTFLSNALDAVLQRRAAQEQERAQRAQAEDHFKQNLAFQQQQAEVQEAARLRDDQRAEAIARADAEQKKAQAQALGDERKSKAFKEATTMFATPGQETAGMSFMQLNRMKMQPKAVDPALMQAIPQLPLTRGAADDDDPEGAWTQSPEAQQAAAQEAERVRKLAEAQKANEGVHTITFDDGTTQDLDIRAMGPTGQAERIRQAIKMMDPLAGAHGDRLAAQVGAGMMKGIDSGKALESARALDVNNKAAMDRARVTGANQRDKRDDMSAGEKHRSMNTEFTGYLNQSKYKEREEEVSQFAKMSALAKAADSSAEAAQMFMGIYTKYAQGQVGVLTPGDIDTFWNKAGSPKDRSEAALNRLLSGEDGPEKRARAMKAIDALSSTAKAKLRKLQEGGQILMEPYGDEGDRLLRAHFGKGLPAQEKSRAEAEADALLGGLNGKGKKGAAK